MHCGNACVARCKLAKMRVKPGTAPPGRRTGHLPLVTARVARPRATRTTPSLIPACIGWRLPSSLIPTTRAGSPSRLMAALILIFFALTFALILSLVFALTFALVFVSPLSYISGIGASIWIRSSRGWCIVFSISLQHRWSGIARSLHSNTLRRRSWSRWRWRRQLGLPVCRSIF